MSEKLEQLQKRITVIKQKALMLAEMELLPPQMADVIIKTCVISSPLLRMMEVLEPADDDKQIDDFLTDNSEVMKRIDEVDEFVTEGITMMRDEVREEIKSEKCQACDKRESITRLSRVPQ